MKLKRGRFTPEGATKIEQQESNHVVYVYTNMHGQLCAIAYGGRRTKPDFQYSFPTEERRAAYIKKYLEDQLKRHRQTEERKALLKQQKKAELEKLKVGAIFHSGWGYEQTQCDFYQLIELKGQTGTFRQIAAATVPGSEGMDCDRRKAVKDKFIGEPFTKRLQGNRFNLESWKSASLVEDPENDSFYCSWYY